MKWNWIGWQTSLLYRLRGSSRLGVNIIITWPQFNSNRRCYCDITVIGGRVRLKSSLQTMSWVSWLLPAFKQAHMMTMNGTKLLWWLWAVIWPDIPSLLPCLSLRTQTSGSSESSENLICYLQTAAGTSKTKRKKHVWLLWDQLLPTHVSSFRTMTQPIVYNKTLNYFSQRGHIISV